MIEPDTRQSGELQLAIADCESHFEQILALQRQNLRQAVAAERHADAGFVFVEHTLDLLKFLASGMPQAIALAEGRVVGYSLAMSPEMGGSVPSLLPMFEQFARMRFRGRPLSDYRFVVGGQVCVDSRWRGRGLIGRLYAETRRRLPPEVELCVTEIATRNRVSLLAHQRIGFEPVGIYRDAVEEWQVVAWPFGSEPASQGS